MKLNKKAGNLKMDVFIDALSLPGKVPAALAHQLLVSLDGKRESLKQSRSPRRADRNEKKMSKIARRVRGKTLRLPFSSREELARRLLLSIEEDDYDDNADELWRKEIARRMTDLTVRAGGGEKARLSLKSNIRAGLWL